MNNKIHFISGLPRSGSTMLAAILKQNPRFIAGMTSPLSTLFKAIEDATAKRQETSVFVSDEQRDKLLKGLFSIYYDHEDKVIFDTSRMWCARLTVLSKLFPQAKFICCVRDVRWIMDSFERIYRKNEQKPSGIYGYDTSGTVYSRTMSIAQSNGVVGYAMDALREACASEQKDRILLVDYEELCKNTDHWIKEIYRFIGEKEFPHKYDRIEYSAGEFDKQLAAHGLHDVKGAVEWRPRETILPPDLFNRFANDNFWLKGK
jgi:sulfotransferase